MDHFFRVINIAGGFLGPAPDSQMQRHASWHARPSSHFADDQYLLDGKGMLMMTQVIAPYKGEDASYAENANFNTQLARARVRSEQVIRQVKGRFAALKELRVQIHEI